MARKMTAREKTESMHFTFNQFKELGFSPEQARAWESAGFSWRTAPTWRAAGFTPEDAQAWRNATSNKADPILPDEARGARARGETPQSYRRNRNRTYPHPMQTR